MTHLIPLLLTALAMEGTPLCTPEPVVLPLAQHCTKADGTPARLPGMPENVCQGTEEKGRLLVTNYVYTVDVGQARSVYTYQTRERWYGKALGWRLQGERVYRDQERVRTAPPLSHFEGPKMRRTRPDTCDLPSITLDDA